LKIDPATGGLAILIIQQFVSNRVDGYESTKVQEGELDIFA
jgi:hypothetical protein